ncbi:glycosyltransferase [Microbacterium sp. NPDC019599]|uniref:glycosyltransferase n=1 Tax=Microbacterium sp. NPDC019599 TaxID=3154690 RepID=UPI0033F0F2CE
MAILPRESHAPELYALQEYLDEKGGMQLDLMPEVEAASTDSLAGYDAVYMKMGFAPRWRPASIPEIHDYSSASTGGLNRGKDLIKSNLSRRPALRSFLSEPVRRCFSFRDDVPHILRDMGVPDRFVSAGMARTDAHEYDLLYAGSITEARDSAELFRAVERSGLTILAVGHPQPTILEEFRSSRQVTFTGSVPYRDIPSFAAKCRFGVNYTPDIRPYRFQTSTKVLEYLALGLPVVTNDYLWVRQFESDTGARMARLAHIGLLDKKTLDFDFKIPKMTEFSWRAVFERAGVYEALRAAV